MSSSFQSLISGCGVRSEHHCISLTSRGGPGVADNTKKVLDVETMAIFSAEWGQPNV